MFSSGDEYEREKASAKERRTNEEPHSLTTVRKGDEGGRTERSLYSFYGEKEPKRVSERGVTVWKNMEQFKSLQGFQRVITI